VCHCDRHCLTLKLTLQHSAAPAQATAAHAISGAACFTCFACCVFQSRYNLYKRCCIFEQPPVSTSATYERLEGFSPATHGGTSSSPHTMQSFPGEHNSSCVMLHQQVRPTAGYAQCHAVPLDTPGSRRTSAKQAASCTAASQPAAHEWLPALPLICHIQRHQLITTRHHAVAQLLKQT
jgi:hypothetical protein